MNIDSLFDIRRLSGALTDQEAAMDRVENVINPKIDSEKMKLNKHAFVVLKGTDDPLFYTYTEISSTVPIRWA